MQLLPETDCLYLSGNGANNLDLAKIQNISSLMLGNCKTMKNIVRRSMNDDGDATVFPSIDHLELFSLSDLKEIWDGPISSNSFQNLKKLLLRNYFQLSTVDCLSQLEVLEIEECEMMEQVFFWNEEEDQNINNRPHNTQVFPKLKEVTLKKLPNLITFSEGIDGIEFPLLTRMQIEECPKMTSMVSSNENNSGGPTNADIDDHHYSQKMSFGKLKELVTSRNPFCGHKVDLSCFNGLQELTISKYESSMSLFSFSIARNLVTLRELYIHECDEIVQVIKDKEEKAVSGDGQRTTLIFPKLQELGLYWLSKLVSFWEWKCDVELPSLRILCIHDCPNMIYFTLGSITTPNLKTAKINERYFGVANDLNVVLQKQYLAREKENQENEKKGSAEDQENKAEIEEERNS